MLVSASASVLVLAMVGCSGGRPPPMAPPPMDREDGEATHIAGVELPALPLDVEQEDLEDGWAAAEHSLTMASPRPPLGEAWEVDAWADDVLIDWVRRRGESVAAAQRALARPRDSDPEVSVVASTLLALAYSRFAFDLRGLPTPPAFADNEARASAFRSALDSMAAPLWQRALDAYGSCSATAASAPMHVLDTWREHCDRERRLLAPMIADDEEADEP